MVAAFLLVVTWRWQTESRSKRGLVVEASIMKRSDTAAGAPLVFFAVGRRANIFLVRTLPALGKGLEKVN